MDHDWAGARADLERALALGESDPETRRRHAYLLLDLGQFEEAVAEGRRAADLDPLGPSVAALAALHQYAGELEPSEAAYRRYLRTWPDSLSGRFGLGTTLLLEGKAREALEELGRLSDRNFRLIGEALAEHALGHARASQAALDELTAGLGDAYPFSIAEIHAWRGEREQALRWLERAIAASDLEPGFRWSPFLRSVREDPRFLAMVRGLGLPAEVTPR
jgi:tetratricopeptide (TPR) repeat protein